MRVRLAEERDAPQVAELLTQLGSKGVDPDEARRRLARGIETVYVAEDGPQLVGLVAVKTDIYFGHAQQLTHLTALVTRDGARRSGVGRLLTRRAVEFAKENGCTGVELTCGINPAREAAHHFYLSMGFLRSAYRYWLPFEEGRPSGSG